MPSTDNPTLELIQQEIMAVMEREKELKRLNSIKTNNNNSSQERDEDGSSVSSRSGSDAEVSVHSNIQKENNISDHNKNNMNWDFAVKMPLMRAKSVSVLNQGEVLKPQNRRFLTNNVKKGLMQKFFKTRGKVNPVAPIKTPSQKPLDIYINDFAPPKITQHQVKYVRNGFVPIDVRMRKEIQEERERELELREIRKSQQNILDALSSNSSDSESENAYPIRATKSMAQLYDSCETLDEIYSAPSSLKPALSLAQLCDAPDDDFQPTQSIIHQFEQMILKNKQDH